MTAGIPERRSVASSFFRRVAPIGVALGTVALSLVGCGGDDDAPAGAAAPVAEIPTTPAPAPAPTSEPAVANQAPTISGTPQPSVTPGTAYAFTPTANDADGDVLTFAVKGRPAWSAFETSTGRLSGTPTQNDVGTSTPIEISATDGEASVALAAFTIDVVGTATASVPLVWTPPTENVDGSPLPDLAGYRISWGTSDGDYPNSVKLMNPGLTRYLVEQLTPASWHFVITALTTHGLESAHSKPAIQEVL